MEYLMFVYPNEEMEAKALDFMKEFIDKGERTINGSYYFGSCTTIHCMNLSFHCKIHSARLLTHKY